MVDIPALLALSDEIKALSQPGTTLPTQLALLEQKLQDSVTSIDAGLQQWKSEWADAYPTGRAEEVRVQGPAIPTFQCQGSATAELETISSPLGPCIYPF